MAVSLSLSVCECLRVDPEESHTRVARQVRRLRGTRDEERRQRTPRVSFLSRNSCDRFILYIYDVYVCNVWTERKVFDKCKHASSDSLAPVSRLTIAPTVTAAAALRVSAVECVSPDHETAFRESVGRRDCVQRKKANILWRRRQQQQRRRRV